MENKHWRLIFDPPLEGHSNMAVDRALLRAVEEGQSPPTVRFYGWDRPTLSVGYSQNIERDVYVQRCVREHVPIVRRPTGGRALLHHHEMTYSVVAPIDQPGFGNTLKETFQTISQMLLEGLGALGIDESILAASAKGRSSQSSPRSPACFSLVNHCEITAHDKKLIGSAQRRTARAFLQHGSLLLKNESGNVVDYLWFQSTEEREAARESLEAGTIALDEILDAPASFDGVARLMAEGFKQKVPGEWKPGILSPYEFELADDILNQN